MTLDVLVLVAALLGSGDTLSGRVADPDGNAVAAATVTVVELHRVALTHADGGYRFTDLPPGRYTITVRAFDQKGNAVSGIAVTLRGSGMERTEIQTDAGDGTADGTATFANVHVQIPANSPTARIDVTVEASGFPTETDSIIVVRQ